jgi:antiviral helicase SLH1
MKALAGEITRKLGKRLAWLRIKVRELTGMCPPRLHLAGC